MALCGGSPAGDYVWMLDALDYAITTWVEHARDVESRPIKEGTLAALADLEQCLPFPLLGLDSGWARIPQLSCAGVAAEASSSGLHDAQPSV